MASFLHRRKVLFDGIEVRGIRREIEQRVARLLDQGPSLRGFVKRCVIHNKDGVGWEFLKEMIFQPDVKPLGIGIPLEQHGGEKALPPLGRQQAGARSGVPTPLPRDPLAFASPPTAPIGGALKPTFIHIHQLLGPLGPMEVSYLLEIRGPFAGISFSVPKSFFYT